MTTHGGLADFRLRRAAWKVVWFPSRWLRTLAVLVSIFMSGEGLALTVTNVKDNPPNGALVSGSLRWAIAKTPVNGVVDFAPSLSGKSITLKAGALVVDKALRIQGHGCDRLTVSGNGVGLVFFVSSGSTDELPGAVISGITITNGNAAGPVGDPPQQNNGGAIYNTGSLVLERVCITGNKASLGSGGGVFNRGALRVVGSSISNNYAGQHGGGICNEQDMTIERSAIFDNLAGGDGGGIQDGGTSRIINTTVARNRASGAGGGINDATGSTLKAFNITVAGNSAASGGGIAVLFGTWDIQNSIVAGNTAPVAPDVRNIGEPGNPAVQATQISVGNNLIGRTTGAGLGSFIESDKLDLVAKLGPLQDNGGGTPTMALLPGSAAIDSGDNRWIEPPILDPALVSDQREFMPRVLDGGTGLRVDMGAFEFASAKALLSRTLELLKPLCSSADRPTARAAVCATRNIEISLDSRLWASDALLTDYGRLIFAFAGEAASSLEKPGSTDRDFASAKTVRSAACCLLLASEQIVRATIDAAEANGGASEDLVVASEKLLQARTAADSRQYVRALGLYEQGWNAIRKTRDAQQGGPNEAACRDLKIQMEQEDRERRGNAGRCVDVGKPTAPARRK